MTALSNLRSRHALSPGDPEAALALAATLIRRAEFNEATSVLRVALAESLGVASSVSRQPLLARLAMLPPRPPGEWRKLHRMSFAGEEAEISTACIVEPALSTPEQALDAEAEHRVFVGFENGMVLGVEASAQRIDTRLDTRRGRVLELAATRNGAHRVLMSRSEGEAALWALRAGDGEVPHGTLLRRLARVSAARFGVYRGKTVWLVGCVDGTLRWLDVRTFGEEDGVEVLDRSPWKPEGHVVWDVAVDPEQGSISLVHWMGLRVYRRFGNNQQLDTTFELADQGGGSARLSSDGRRALVVRRSGEAEHHRLIHYDLRALQSDELDLGMSLQGWRTDAELRFLAAWSSAGLVRLFDLERGEVCGEWSDCRGVREVWPDSHARGLWLVYADRMELMG